MMIKLKDGIKYGKYGKWSKDDVSDRKMTEKWNFWAKIGFLAWKLWIFGSKNEILDEIWPKKSYFWTKIDLNGWKFGF